MSEGSESSSSEDSEPEYYVERILAERVRDGRTSYLVKWSGYPDNQCTWEPAIHFLSPDTLEEWGKQLSLGDTLDDEQIAEVQARMDEYQAAAARRTSPPRKQKADPKPVGPHLSSPGASPPPAKRARLQQTSATPPILNGRAILHTEVGDKGEVASRPPEHTQMSLSQTGDRGQANNLKSAHKPFAARRTEDRTGQRFKNL